MELHISSSLRNVRLFRSKGMMKEFRKGKVGSRKYFSYTIIFYSFLFFLLLLRFMFVLTTIDSIHSDHTNCSSIGCLGRRLGPRILRAPPSENVQEVMIQILEEPLDEESAESDVPQSLGRFIADIRNSNSDVRTFALKLKSLMNYLEQKTRKTKIQEYLYRQIASSTIPKELHCLSLRLTNEHAANSKARLQLPQPEQTRHLIDNSFFHFVIASDNVLATSVVAKSLVQNSARPEKIVLHVITDKHTYSAMHAWFSLHSLSPSVIEVKALHHFDWFSKGKVPILEVMEKDHKARSRFGGGEQNIVRSDTEKPGVIAAKLQAMSPKYNSIMNHIRIHLPELFPSLEKVVFLDDDIVIQTDLSPLWDIDMKGKVNGAVETCNGKDTYVMSKRFKNYLNFSHSLISDNFDPEQCAWAYGMNIFDLNAWKKTNVTKTYYHWLDQNLKSDLSLYQLGTLPPGLIAFQGQVHTIEPFWHMLGLGYQENTSLSDATDAGVIHFNGRAKPWLEIALPQLRPLWAKHIDFSDKFIKDCRIKET